MTHDYKDSDHCARCGHEQFEPGEPERCFGLEINSLNEIEGAIIGEGHTLARERGVLVLDSCDGTPDDRTENLLKEVKKLIENERFRLERLEEVGE